MVDVNLFTRPQVDQGKFKNDITEMSYVAG